MNEIPETKEHEVKQFSLKGHMSLQPLFSFRPLKLIVSISKL